MITVYKYRLDLVGLMDGADLRLPVGAEVLSVGLQGKDAFLWARVDTEAALETRRFRIAGTGEDLEDCASWRFVGHFRYKDLLEFFLFEEP